MFYQAANQLTKSANHKKRDDNLSNRYSFQITTLGCKVNQYESDKMKEELFALGFQEAKKNEKADLYIINTCSVTHIADRKSRQHIRKAINQNPQAKIIAAGCSAENKNSGINKISGNITIIGNKGKEHFKTLITQLFPECTSHHIITNYPLFRNRAYLKTGDGCQNFCSYCVIPYVRGPLTSRPSKHILQEAQLLAASGCKEIILTAIHLGAYGYGLQEKTNLASLLEQLACVLPGVRIRLSSIEPLDFSENIIKVMKKHANICKHVHLSLQHSSNKILKAMNRNYTQNDFRNIVAKIREIIPNITITADIIVGFPGETEEDFQELKKFTQEIKFYKCHVFKFSPRKGTPAASYPNQTPEDEKRRRSSELIELSSALSLKTHKDMIGDKVEVLVESQTGENCDGFTSNYVKVKFKSNKNLLNSIATIKITDIHSEYVMGLTE